MPVAGIDERAVSMWMSANVEGAEPPFVFRPIPGGNSNLTYRVRGSNGREFALRRPPMGRILESAHDMAREYRLISALQGSRVPVPPALGLCSDPGVNEAPFYVMGFVDGVVLHDRDAGGLIPPDDRPSVANSAVRVLANLHLLDPDEIGLGDLGRREGYLQRQLYRWARQLEASKQRDLPAMDRARGLLEDRVPRQERASVVHGDYRLGNLIVDGGKVRAVVDWELCTLGDPLADLGYLALDWIGPDEPSLWRSSAIQAGGFPRRDDMVAMYMRLTGADVSRIRYYEAFQSWRLAAILEGVYARYLHGAMANIAEVDLGELARSVERLADHALEQLGVGC
ncbi:MAG: phosphotransferase family protein [bacterium]|nr:phosphotransferase family protein [bacterium]MDE0287411.1 phosphotransferase family protein [bacterium]MDE0438831.1 phosphotransferase family protein [bacterium]